MTIYHTEASQGAIFGADERLKIKNPLSLALTRTRDSLALELIPTENSTFNWQYPNMQQEIPYIYTRYAYCYPKFIYFQQASVHCKKYFVNWQRFLLRNWIFCLQKLSKTL